MMANLAMGRILNCAILVHTERAATDEEWDRWIAFVVDSASDQFHAHLTDFDQRTHLLPGKLGTTYLQGDTGLRYPTCLAGGLRTR